MLKLVTRTSKFFYSIAHYFDGPTKLFSDLYSAKFLDTSAKPLNSFIFNYLWMLREHCYSVYFGT